MWLTCVRICYRLLKLQTGVTLENSKRMVYLYEYLVRKCLYLIKILQKMEFLAHMSNRTWQIVEGPLKRKVIGNKFVLRTKDEHLKKVWLVAKGYAQCPGADIHEVSSTVARSTSVRLFTALSTEKDLQVHLIDVFTAYINGDLDEDIYMDVPALLMSVLKKIESVAGITSTRKSCVFSKISTVRFASVRHNLVS